MSGREYDIILYGATGYTGKLAALYMATDLPTDMKWAIAGRSESKLQVVAADCKQRNPDRIQPNIEICNLDDAEFGDLARKTEVLISTVGPYCMYGEYAFKACAENGTHYLDCTGEVPWVQLMIKKYEKAAQNSGAIMIPQSGIESVPPDLIAWSLVSLITKELSAPTAEVILSQHDLVASISGGTGLTALSLLDIFSIAEVGAAEKPFALSPIPGPSSKSSAGWLTKIFGIRKVPELGLLTSGLQASSDVPIVQRSWGLFGGAKLYGPKFFFSEYLRTNGYLQGIGLHMAITIGFVFLAVAPIRRFLKRFIYASGDGPTEEESKKYRAEYRAIGVPDVAAADPPKAYCRAYFEGGMYHLTGIFLTQAALTILKDDVVAKKWGGGILTPSTLGQAYIDRLSSAGFKLETKILR